MTAPDPARHAAHRQALVAALVEEGTVHSAPWQDAFAAVPRHVFLPRFFRPTPDGRWQALDAEDPDWADLVYQDTTWVTQLDDDPTRWRTARRTGPVPGTPTSSSSAPRLMALMLEALEVADGHRVLEVGTGTGYNAALLAHRLGDTAVTTVEVDPTVAAQARSALRTAGHTPTVVVGDGQAGHRPGAPYDRILATYSTPTVPAPWITQTCPGGRILTGLHRSLDPAALIILTVTDAGTATGRFLPEHGSFMPARCCRVPAGDLGTALGQTGRSRPTALVFDHHAPWLFFAALHLHGLTWTGFTPADTDRPQDWLIAPDGSWARLDAAAGTVEQHGPRRVWDEVEALHARWRALGAPDRDRFGLTVTPDGRHTLWLDDPATVVTADLRRPTERLGSYS